MTLYAKLRGNSWYTFMFNIKKLNFMWIAKYVNSFTKSTYFSNYEIKLVFYFLQCYSWGR